MFEKEMLDNENLDKEKIVLLRWSRLPSPAVPPHLAKTADRIDFKIEKAIEKAWKRAHGDVDEPMDGGIGVVVGVDRDGVLWYDTYVCEDDWNRWGKAEDELYPFMVQLMTKPQFVKDCRKMADAIRKNPELFG